jgi:hypothetical protein
MPVAAGDVRGKAQRQLRIENDGAGKHLRVEDDLLGFALLVKDHAGPADLGAGAGSGWDGDDRGDAGGIGAGPPIADVLEVPERASLARHEGDDLPHVERTAAAESDDAVMAPVAVSPHPRFDVGADRVRMDCRKERGSKDGGEGGFHHRRLSQARIGDEERPLHPQGPADVRQLRDPAGAEADRGRIIPVGVGQGHQPLLRWKDLGRDTAS